MITEDNEPRVMLPCGLKPSFVVVPMVHACYLCGATGVWLHYQNVGTLGGWEQTRLVLYYWDLDRLYLDYHTGEYWVGVCDECWW